MNVYPLSLSPEQTMAAKVALDVALAEAEPADGEAASEHAMALARLLIRLPRPTFYVEGESERSAADMAFNAVAQSGGPFASDAAQMLETLRHTRPQPRSSDRPLPLALPPGPARDIAETAWQGESDRLTELLLEQPGLQTDWMTNDGVPFGAALAEQGRFESLDLLRAARGERPGPEKAASMSPEHLKRCIELVRCAALRRARTGGGRLALA